MGVPKGRFNGCGCYLPNSGRSAFPAFHPVCVRCDEMIKICPFEQKYRDDMFFCMLLAKEALGRTPSINEDLFDIQGNYFRKGDMFWVAVEEERVVGMAGTRRVSSTDMWLKRLYVKPSTKRRGIGGALLATAEDYAVAKGIASLHTRFSDDYVEAVYFYPAKGFVEDERSDGLRHFVKSLTDQSQERVLRSAKQ